MKHIGTQNIETSRLLLRQFKINDVDDMLKNCVQDEEVTRFLTWQPHENKATTINILNEWIHQYAKLDYYNWAIVLKDCQEVIGNIAVV